MDKIAAIWARISTSDQTSLPDQIARAKEKLEGLGCMSCEWAAKQPIHIFFRGRGGPCHTAVAY